MFAVNIGWALASFFNMLEDYTRFFSLFSNHDSGSYRTRDTAGENIGVSILKLVLSLYILVVLQK